MANDTCCMCGRTSDDFPIGTAFWTIVVRITSKLAIERQVCNTCELRHRQERRARA